MGVIVVGGVPCGPLIRPTGTFSPLGRRGSRDVAANPFAPAGRRWRQPDEGASRNAANKGPKPIASGRPDRRRRLVGRWPG
ncbi:hypothetical protein B5P46_09160 [Rhizobium leguminosarum]|uniref:Uncharacterized protein n=1 Tax=Rhizobium leguminosarum TaxID=384 RepID=A0A4Q1UAF7_RHILE|nr:hypothetical protein B5P46_09160 [Rhizobium leguminosarum]